jgi:hypothetical protein
MQTMLKRGAARWWALSALIVLISCGIAVGAEEKSLKERMNAESHRIMMQFKNGAWRLEMNFKGMGSAKALAPTESTPFRVCCSNNIKKLEAAFKTLDGIFKELAQCYEQAGDNTELADLELTKSDLAQFVKLIRQMSETASRDEALAKSSSATNAYLNFVESAEAVADCPKVEQKKAE